ncbi:polyphosphate polymerase domain-containing protein [Actinoplanes sp. GCM10030250]|uniref:polyphosphate polymerase domain-containing protein n=1 Tax=Actinoplanes sp. GCM10030250 TaxID=3273376 RepID=UPI0036147DB3
MTAVIEAPALHRFRPITLAELVVQAALMTRLDRKYLVPAAELPGVLDRMPAGVRMLEIEGRREFAYRSVYFDTAGLDSYLAAARRRRRRFKIRVRTYLDTGDDFLEVKTRAARGMTVKDRIPYAGSRTHLDRDGLTHVAEVLGGAGLPARGHEFSPVLATHYHRSTLYVPGTGSRVTVDSDLTWMLPGGSTVRMPDSVIVETKSARSASDVDRLLWSLHLRPSSISKYATGLAALRPELPANRWHPVLQRHFSGGPS